MQFKIKNNTPRTSARILIMGPPGSGRSTIAKNLCNKYKFVYLSTTELICDQINKRSEIGKISHNLITKGELSNFYF